MTDLTKKTDGHEIVLTLIDVVPVVADFERIPNRVYRANFHIMNKLRAMRNAMRLLRYRF